MCRALYKKTFLPYTKCSLPHDLELQLYKAKINLIHLTGNKGGNWKPVHLKPSYQNPPNAKLN